MATITVTYVPSKAAPVDEADAKKAFTNLRTVFDNNKNNQHGEIEKHLQGLIKKKNSALATALGKAKCTVTGYDSDEEKRSGQHEMKVLLVKTEIAKNRVWINKPATGKGINIGLNSARTSEQAAAILLKNRAKIEGLALKKGDGDHKNDLLWSIGTNSGSLPLTTHTKGSGGSNEKAALSQLKKVMAEAGFV